MISLAEESLEGLSDESSLGELEEDLSSFLLLSDESSRKSSLGETTLISVAATHSSAAALAFYSG